MKSKRTEVNTPMENAELNKVICRLFREIAEREKKKAIDSDDYGTAFVAAVVEGILKEVELAIN